jgi:Protein of unknown function (DUF1579)
MKPRNWNRTRRLACSLAAVLLVLALAPAALAADKPGGKAAAAPQMSEQEMMAAYMKYATPGPEHALLKSMAGTWKAVTKSWMGPGDPQVSEGSAVRTMILGGRYLKDEFTSTFMDQPFQGFGITGYDLSKKEYVSTWSDTLGTGIVMSHGTADPSGKVLTMTGTYEDPVTGEKKTMKQITRIVDANRHVFEIWEDRGGKEVKSMEITYTRD